MNLTCVCLVRRAEEVAMLYEIIEKKFALFFLIVYICSK